MGCRKLDIRSQFRFIDAPEKSHSHEGTADYTQKTAYSRFSHTVISNYRYYSPELGRWLSRDPLYERGSTAWFKFNREDEVRRQIENASKLLQILDLLYELSPHFNEEYEKYKQLIVNLKNSLEFELNQEITGTHFNVNPYSFCNNNPTGKWDKLGLVTVGEVIKFIADRAFAIPVMIIRIMLIGPSLNEGEDEALEEYRRALEEEKRKRKNKCYKLSNGMIISLPSCRR